MKPNTPFLRATGLAMALALLAVTTLHADTEDVIKQSYTVKPGGQLVLRADRGSVEVMAGPGDKVEVVVTRVVKASEGEKAQALLKTHTVRCQQEGSRIEVRGETERGSFWRNLGRQLQVQFQVTVPAQFDADIQTAGGSIRVADLTGTIHCETAGGNLDLGRITGPVKGETAGGSIHLAGGVGDAKLETSGGNIKVGDTTGNLKVQTAGGSIAIKQAKGKVEAETSGGNIDVAELSGDIHAETSGGSVGVCFAEKPVAECRLATSGGNIRVRLAESVAVNIDAQTSGGRVVANVPVTVQGPVKSHALKGAINGGGPGLILEASGGSIYLDKK